ncbi:MAG: hypothetical protein CMN25_19255 [Salinicola sp.]|nr:hypothetical protein [Salinicola sp.]
MAASGDVGVQFIKEASARQLRRAAIGRRTAVPPAERERVGASNPVIGDRDIHDLQRSRATTHT